MILLISPKQVYATARFRQEAKKSGLAVEIVDVKDLAKRNFKVDVSQYQTLYVRQSYPYNAEIVSLAKKFAKAGRRVVDHKIANGDLGLGKWEMYQSLMKAGLPVPHTSPVIASPPLADVAIPSNKGLLWSFSLPRNDRKAYPYVLKWNYGFGGQGTFLIDGEAKLEKIANIHPPEELLLQEFIAADYEYKIITVGFKALPVILKLKIKDLGFKPDFSDCQIIFFGKNHPPLTPPLKGGESYFVLPFPSKGGRGEEGVKGVKKIIEIAEKASKVLGRELAKVDILQKGNQLYILEVNRTPGLSFFERKSRFNVAGEFVRYLAQQFTSK